MRPSLLTPDRARRIADLVSAGNPTDTAARAVGVSESTFYSWMARGKAERERLEQCPRSKIRASERPYVEFLESIEKARAEAEARLVLLIHKAAQEPRTWQAAAWLLERRDPKKWGRPWRPVEDKSTSKAGAIQEAISTLTNTPHLPGEETQ